ncbi:MAG: non-hydrolyzing UDP-N-acetylglucosamine 2-epimerase [Caldisericia bacterium]
MIKVLIIFGTRPEVIKLYPLIELLKEDKDFDLKILNTGQHKEMVNELLNIFNIKPHYSLNIMIEKQSLEHITKEVIDGVSKILKEEKFDIVIVQGDTTTTFISSLTSFYYKIPIGHVEAGLRTNNMYYPFPEEMNRTLVGKLASLHFAPTESAKNNLLREGVNKDKIFVTGNTIVDAVQKILNFKINFKMDLPDDKKIITVTAHRRESWENGLSRIGNAIKTLSKKYEDLFFVIPIHKNPVVREKIVPILKGVENILITEPLDYVTFIHLLKKSFIILSDSGGIQEEAPTINKPVLLLRNETERPEGVKTGFVRIVGTDEKRIFENVKDIIENGWKPVYNYNPFGDGKASERIKNIIKEYFYGSI